MNDNTKNLNKNADRIITSDNVYKDNIEFETITSDDIETPYIPPSVVTRLPRYYRFLRGLASNDQLRISSNELARMMKTSPSQVRQDLNHFGTFGNSGYGYNVRELFNEIGSILGMDDSIIAALVGEGMMTNAISGMPVFRKHGIKLACKLDEKEFVYWLYEWVKRHKSPRLIIITNDDPETSAIAGYNFGTRCFVNISDVKELDPDMVPGSFVTNISLADVFMSACCNIKSREGRFTAK